MSEGDITRLNRMYDCREFIKKENKKGNVEASKGKPKPNSKNPKSAEKVPPKGSSKKPKVPAKSNTKKPSKDLKKLKQHEYKSAGAKESESEESEESEVTAIIEKLQVAIEKLITVLQPLGDIQGALENISEFFNNLDE